jgi:hypothetical protein
MTQPVFTIGITKCGPTAESWWADEPQAGFTLVAASHVPRMALSRYRWINVTTNRDAEPMQKKASAHARVDSPS